MVARLLMGSRLYGTSNETSDFDIKTIKMPSAHDILMGRTNVIYQPVGQVNPETNEDEEITDLVHFFNRLRSGNTAEIESLFCTEENTLKASSTWREIVKQRMNLISKDIGNMLGFIVSNANKLQIDVPVVEQILTYLEKENQDNPARSTRLGTQRILHSVFQANNPLIYFTEIENAEDVPMTHIVIFGKAIPKNIRLANACKIVRGIIRAGKENNVSKSHYNALRLAEEAVDLLKNGEILFPRINAGQLIDIKNGNYSITRVKNMIDERVVQIKNLQKHTDLPDRFSEEIAEQIICAAHRETVIFG